MKELDIHKNAEDELYNVFRCVIESGENNSAMVIGPRGSGKTFLVKKCLEKVISSLRAKNASTDILLVNLSGQLQLNTGLAATRTLGSCKGCFNLYS